MTASLDTLTILTTKGPLATKRIVAVPGGAPKIEDYGKALRFSFDEWPISSFDDMAATLETLQRRPQSFLVRGKPVYGINRENAPRRSRPRGDEPATLLPQPRYWLPLDLDSVPCLAGIDPIWEPDAVVEHVVELLPEAFHGCSVFWMFTSGQGIKPGIRIRLFFWLDRPLADWEIKIWLAGPIAEKLIDGSLFSPAQAIYVAQPVFVGMPDPVPYRRGTWTGHCDAVEVPAIEDRSARPAARQGRTGETAAEAMRRTAPRSVTARAIAASTARWGVRSARLSVRPAPAPTRHGCARIWKRRSARRLATRRCMPTATSRAGS